jgi:hypothetical protein
MAPVRRVGAPAIVSLKVPVGVHLKVPADAGPTTCAIVSLKVPVIVRQKVPEDV